MFNGPDPVGLPGLVDEILFRDNLSIPRFHKHRLYCLICSPSRESVKRPADTGA